MTPRVTYRPSEPENPIAVDVFGDARVKMLSVRDARALVAELQAALAEYDCEVWTPLRLKETP